MKTSLMRMVAALALISAASPASAVVNLISNGSFESGEYVNSGNGFGTVNSGSSAITDWSIGSGSVDWINTYWQAQHGNFSIDLNGTSIGSIQQSIATVAGQTYTLSFYVSANPDNGLGAPTLTASAGDQSFDLGYTLFPANNHSQMNWDFRSFNFVATGTSTVIGFTSTTENCCWGPALDNVTVSAVPELSTWAMMLFGFAGVGFWAYRRTNRIATAVA